MRSRRARTQARRTLGLLIGAALLESRCASLEGRSQKVTVASRPPGATVRVMPGDAVATTPTTLVLPRRLAHTLWVEREGYCRETVYLDRLSSPDRALGLLPGVLIDIATGAGYRLEPDVVDVLLWPLDSPDRVCGSAGAVPPRDAATRPRPDPL
jgi:hypothetical protein